MRRQQSANKGKQGNITAPASACMTTLMCRQTSAGSGELRNEAANRHSRWCNITVPPASIITLMCRQTSGGSGELRDETTNGQPKPRRQSVEVRAAESAASARRQAVAARSASRVLQSLSSKVAPSLCVCVCECETGWSLGQCKQRLWELNLQGF